MNNSTSNLEDHRTVGRPALGISPESYIEQYRVLRSWQSVADYFGVSRQTVYRVLKLAGYKRNYTL